MPEAAASPSSNRRAQEPEVTSALPPVVRPATDLEACNALKAKREALIVARDAKIVGGGHVTYEDSQAINAISLYTGACGRVNMKERGRGQ